MLIENVKIELIEKGFNWDKYGHRVNRLFDSIKDKTLPEIIDVCLVLDDDLVQKYDQNGDITYDFSNNARVFIKNHASSVEVVLSSLIDEEDRWMDFNKKEIKSLIKDISEECEVKKKNVSEIIKIALAFTLDDIDIVLIMEILGFEECTTRFSVVREIAMEMEQY